jgi:apolipoprotein N-acyltransferase
MRWYTRLALIVLTVLLLSLSLAPFGQFYLAWVGLVPWLLMVRGLKTQRAAFFWGWGAGILFFTANMWWLVLVTGPGMVALMFLLGLYWAVTAVILRGAGWMAVEEDRGSKIEDSGEAPARRRLSSILYPLSSSPTGPSSPTAIVLLIPAIWVSLEWLRGNWPLNGLPWLFMGHGQTPVLPMCQIADSLGVYGISFWVVSINTLVALFILDRLKFRRLGHAAVIVSAMLAFVLAYGLWRMRDTKSLVPGPVVMVVQSNYPQSNTGEKGATQDELLDFHVETTDRALRQWRGEPVELVVWSETMMPFLNVESRTALADTNMGEEIEKAHAALTGLTRSHGTALLTGGLFADQWTLKNNRWIAADRRNTAFFYDRTGRLADDLSGRYDKVHIVPFGEYLPWKTSAPLLHRLFVALSPYPDEYFLTPGDESAMRPFRMSGRESDRIGPRETWRFVTPICFEDIDPLLVAKMFRSGDPQRAKAADFIVNVTNDGWFMFNQMPQHLQAARFRSIENRAPTARSVNTGISGFIDSFGRVQGVVPAGTEGTSVQRLQLDPRVTLYTRLGDAFAAACALVTVLVAAASVVRWAVRRRQPVIEPDTR